MKIDIGNYLLIKMKFYWIFLNKCKIIDKVIDDMFDFNIIWRLKLFWSFFIVVVDKKDGLKRFCVDFR